MQLLPGPYTLPWPSTADNSDLSIQWNQLSRHYSTEGSSSIGSMDSLDPPSSQVYYGSHNSPVDPAIFNNKRDYDSHNSPVDPVIFNNKGDSAYSSFSASSNMSDYTVSLRPGEACSIENILRSLGPEGPACQVYACGNAPSLGRESGEAQDETAISALLLKSRSLTRPRVRQTEAKERPSSYCFEKEGRGERGGGGGERGASSPPQPPTRKDSFRATKGRLGITDFKDQRCISAPVGIPSFFRCHAEDDDDDTQNVPGVPVVPSRNGYPAPCKMSKAEGDMGNGKRNGVGNFKVDSLEQYYTLISQKKDCLMIKNSEIQEIHPDSLHLPAPERSSPSSIPSSLHSDSFIYPDSPGEVNHLLPQNKHCSSGLYRHSAPEKLLSQLRHLEFSSDASEPLDRISPSPSPSSSQWPHSPLNPPREDRGGDIGSQYGPLLLQQNQGKWEGGSLCSTPGSVDIDGIGEAGDVSVVVGESMEVVAAAGTLLSPIQVQRPWGRPVSVPGSGEPSGGCTQGEVSSERVWETDFGPLSAAASVDSLLEGNHRGGGGGKRYDNEGEVLMKKPRSHRSSLARRRSERFATSLRNEIQHKKAQLSKSKGQGGLLYSGETVEEEEGPDLEIQDFQREEAEVLDPTAKASSSQGLYTCSDVSLSAPAPGGLNRLSSSSTPQLHQLSPAPVSALQPPRDEYPEPPENQDQVTDPSRTPQRSDPTIPSWDMGIQVVEELAPAGKARRWRWTPEHKLQPEIDTDRRGERAGVALGVSGRGRASSTSSATSTSSTTCSYRTEESDILPFADRCKFFEETSRSILVSNLTYRRQRPDRHERQPHPPMENQGGGYGQGQAQRRYSYQGGFQRESPLSISTMEARRQSVSGNREREKEREKERERERERERGREERARERGREERAREREREERAREREERARERERLLEREEMVREMEREERARERERLLEREEMVREREREERAREREIALERERKREREEEGQREERARLREMEKERQRERESLGSAQDLYASQTQPHAYPYPQPHSHRQSQIEAPRSAFHPVNTALLQDNQALHQGYPPRSYTPTVASAYPARPLPREQTQINRKFSLTERDSPRYRRDSSTSQPDCAITVTPEYHLHQQVSQSGGCWSGRLSSCSMDKEDHQQTSMVVNPTSSSYSSSSLLRSRAMSENNLHFDSTYCRASPSVAMATPLSELEEGGGVEGGRVGGKGVANRNKTLRPPRPPPPKWEQFHRRRASHHTLIASASSSVHPSLNPTPPPLPLTPPEGPTSHPSHPSSHPCHHEKSEMTRQRSYSLSPQREELEGCNRSQVQEWPFSQAPPSPGFTRRAFRPLAPPQREKFTPPSYDDTLPPSESCARLCKMGDQDCPAVLRARAQWERTQSPRVHSVSGPFTIENGVLSPESYFTMSYEQQQQLQQNRRLLNHPHNNNNKPELEQELLELEPESEFSPSPAQSLEQEVDIPMETDIDDFQEEGLPEDEEPIRTELQCFALPVTVLETDIDTLPDQEASPAGRITVENGSLDGEMEDQGMRTREGLMEELFPQSSEGEAGTESWRGAYRSPNLEHNTDSLDRRSGASSSCSSYYSTSAAKAQLLTQMKDSCSDTRDTDDDDDDELSYKRQLMESLRKKLGVLREAQRGLQEDMRANAQLGEEVESLVLAFCKPNEVDKFRMFIGDLDKVVSLLLSLSGRLLRVESSLDNLEAETGHHERLPLLEKKRHLLVQLSEAQDLKEHVDRREQAVGRALGRCLSPEQHRDYSHYVKMKAALLVEQRQLEDKLRLGEEQLRGLRESLGLGLGMSMGYGHY